MTKFTVRIALAFSFSLVSFQRAFGTGNDNPTGVTGQYNGSITTAGSYDPYTGNAIRTITDLSVTGAVGAYPLKWSRTLNTRNLTAPKQVGRGGWTHSYQWSIYLRTSTNPDHWNDETPDYYEGPDAVVYYPDGRQVWFEGAPGYDYVGAPEQDTSVLLKHVGGGNYDLYLPDGGIVQFELGPYLDGTVMRTGLLATRIKDPYGVVTTLHRDSAGRLWRVQEQGGRFLQINYTNQLITSVQAFASEGNLVETVSYVYGYLGTYLTQVNYDDFTHAYYTYQGSNHSTTNPALVRTCDDVRYAGPMGKIEYVYMPMGAGIDFGQIKGEKYPGMTALVSQVTYPGYNCCAWNDPAGFVRTETRADGATRRFQYQTGGGELVSWSDFKDQWSTTTRVIEAGNPFLRRINTDARTHATTIEKTFHGKTNRLFHPGNTSYQAFVYEYVNGYPYYLQIHGDELGRNTYYTRDGNHRVSKIWYEFDPNNHGAYPTEEFTYNGFGQVETHKLKSGGTENFRYDGRGLKYLSWPAATPSDPSPETHPTRYFYYTSGPNTDRLYYMVDPRGNATWFEYNGRGQVTKVTHQDGTYTQSAYNPDGTLQWSEDELRHRTTYEYDEYKRVIRVTNALNQTTHTNYAQDWANPLFHTTNNPKGTTLPSGKQIHYAYDENWRRIIRRDAPDTADDAWTWFAYDPVGNLINTTDPRGHITCFGYDNRNRQTSAINALNQTTTTTYDAVGNKTKETRHDGTFRSWKYDMWNRLWKAEDWRTNQIANANQTTTYGRDHAGNATSITDQKGAIYSFFYDAQSRKIAQTYPPDATGVSRSENWSFDAAGNLYRHDNPATEVQIFVHDSRNRRTDSYWWGYVGQHITTSYDAASRVTGITTKRSEVFETSVTFEYDDGNRVKWEDQTVAGYPTRRVQHDRDVDGNASNTHIPGWYLLWHGYTQRNQLAQIQDGAGTPWYNFSYDAAGNMTKRQAVYAGVNDSTNAPSQYYDPLNRPTMWENTRAGDNWFARSWQQYDSVGRMTATWRDEQASKGERFRYNALSQVTNASYDADQAWTDTPQNAQRTVEYGLDPLNRLTVSDTASPKANGLSATYYSNDNFTGSAVLRNDAAVNFAWNGAAPAPGMPGEGFSVRWEGQVVPRYSQTYTFYTQSDDGVRLWVDGKLLIDNWTYHAWTENSGTVTLVAGQRYSIRMEYFQGGGGAIAALLWSSPSQGKEVIPSSQLHAARPANGLQATYYDNIDFTGTKVLRTDPAINFNWGGGAPEPALGVDSFSGRWEGQIVPRFSETYTFYAGSDDGVRLWINGQLIVDNWWDRGHTEGTGTINLVLGQSYDIRMEYYENGGGASATLAWSSARQPKEIVPQSQLFVPAEGGNYRTSALNQYTSIGGQTLGYDGRFNLTGYAGATFTYDAQNRLVSASKGGKTVQFTYDGLGRCLKRTTNGAVILFAYDGWKPLAEWAGDGAWWAYRIYGPGADEVLWSYDSRVGNMRVHSDVHGNVIALLDYSGNQIEKYSYDAFGRPKIMDAAGNQREKSQYGNRFLFQGREWIPELGIYDYRNRMYHPGLGRFLQTDPIGFDAGDMNLFRYCGDDPVNGSDPLGLEDISISPEWHYLGVMASLNSRSALLTRGGAGYSQIVQRNDATGKLSLQTNRNGSARLNPAKAEDHRVYDPKERKTVTVTKLIETGNVSKGHTGAGIGHVHSDRRFRGVTEFSPEDWALAQGRKATVKTPAVKGQPVWKVLESDGSRVARLTPQKAPGDRPTEQAFNVPPELRAQFANTAKDIEPADPTNFESSAGGEAFDQSFKVFAK